eukprot:5300909-Heterocapsa_arctica.AAC.1
MEDDGRTLSDYDVQNGATVVLAIRARGGMPAAKGPTKKQLADAIIAKRSGGVGMSHATLMRLKKEELGKLLLEMQTKESVGVGTSSPR